MSREPDADQSATREAEPRQQILTGENSGGRRGGPRPAGTTSCTSEPISAITAATAPSPINPLADRGRAGVVNTSWHAVDQPSTRCGWPMLTANSLPSDVTNGWGRCAACGSECISAEWPRMTSAPAAATMATKDRNRGRRHALSLTISGRHHRACGPARNSGAQPGCAAIVSSASDNPRVTPRLEGKRGTT